MSNSLSITSADSEILDALATKILTALGNEVDKLKSFKLLREASKLSGSGDAPIIEIQISYDRIDQEIISQIKKIIQATSKEANIEVKINDK